MILGTLGTIEVKLSGIGCSDLLMAWPQRLKCIADAMGRGSPDLLTERLRTAAADT